MNQHVKESTMINFLFYRSGVVLPEPEHYLEPEPSIFWSRNIFWSWSIFWRRSRNVGSIPVLVPTNSSKGIPGHFKLFLVSLVYFIFSILWIFEFINYCTVYTYVHFKMLLVHCGRSRTLLLLLKHRSRRWNIAVSPWILNHKSINQSVFFRPRNGKKYMFLFKKSTVQCTVYSRTVAV